MAISGQTRKCALVIQSSVVSGTSHSDFPVLLTADTLPSEMLDTTSSYPAQSDGGDIRFSSDSAGTTELAFEIIDWTQAAGAGGTAQIWVKVPTVSGSSDTTIYVWYNTSGTTSGYSATDTYGRNAVWSDYVAVWHMDDASTTDATGNSHTITWQNTPSTSAGPFGGNVAEHDGDIGDYGSVSDADDLSLMVDSSDEHTVSVWVYPNNDPSTSTSEGRVLYKDTEYFGALQTATDVAYKPRWATFGSTNYANVDASVDDGQWNLVHWVIDTGTGYEAFVGGVTEDNGQYLSTDTSSNTTNVFYIFGFANAYRLSARMAELRIRGDLASSDWIATEYANQNSPATFVVEGTPEDVGGGTTVTADTGSFTLTGNAATLTVGRKLAADAQSYTLTGQDAALKRGFVALAEAGTITFTGQAAALIAARKIAAAQVSYAYTGNDAGLTYTPAGSYDLVADAASYTLTGIAATLAVDRLIGAQTAAYTLTGVDAGLTYTPAGATTMTAETAVFALTGQASALLYARILPATVQTYTVTGQDVALRRGYSLALDAGAYSLSGLDVDWARTYQVAAGVGAYTLTGRNVTLDYSAAEVLDPGYCAPVVRAARYASIVRADRHAPIIRR